MVQKYLRQILDYCHNPSPKSELLPYRYYDKEHNLFINKGSNIGFLLELDPLVGIKDETYKQLSLLFDEFLPENSLLHFLMIAGGNITQITEDWNRSYNKADDLLKKISSKRIDYLQGLSQNGEGAYRLKNYSIIVSFSISTKYSKIAINEINNFRNQLEALLRSCSFNLKRMDIHDFLNIVGDILSPGSSAPEYNEYQELSLQLDIANPILIDESKVIHGSQKTNKKYISKAYCFEQTPKKFSLDLMINLLGDSLRDNLQIPGRLVLSYSISNDISSKKQEILKDKGNEIVKQSDSYFVRFDNLIKKEIGEWSEALELVNSGKKFLSTSFNLLLTEREQDFAKAEQYLTSVYVINGFKIKSLDNFMLPGFLSCLPFGPGCGVFKLFKNYGLASTTVSTTPLAFLPIHGEWKGNSGEGVLLAGRRGQVFTINPFIGESNYNVNIIGQSGSGKSVMLQDMVSNFLCSGTKVFVLDIGRSYEKLCNLYGGDFIEFKMDSNICLNPFDRANTSSQETQNDFLSLIIPIIAKMIAPKRGTTDIEDSIIAKVLQTTWQEKGNKTSISDIAKNLEYEGSEVAKDLAKMLFQYCDNGTYGRFFNGKSNIDFNNRLTVIEFEELRERQDLLSVIMQMLSAQIMTKVFAGDRQQKFVILFDEAWFALELFPGLLASLARTIRKYFGSLILGTQSVNDYYINETAKSILENSGWLFMMKQKKESVDLLMESKRMSLDAGQIQLIKSLNVVPGKYSECLISSSSGYVVGRLILDPFSKILYSTSPKEFGAVQKLIKSGYKVENAIEEVAENIYGRV